VGLVGLVFGVCVFFVGGGCCFVGLVLGFVWCWFGCLVFGYFILKKKSPYKGLEKDNISLIRKKGRESHRACETVKG